MKRSFMLSLIAVFSCGFLSAAVPQSHEVGAAVMPDTIAPIHAPFEMPDLQKPVFPDREINIAKAGAKQGKLCTEVINRSIDKLSQKGGGRVLVPAGKWLTGRIMLKSNVNLHVAEGAELCFSGEVKDYLPAVFTRNEGIEMYSLGALIYANGAENIALTGKGTLVGPTTKCEIYDRQMRSSVVEKFVPADKPVEERVYDGNNGTPVFLPMFFAPINCKNILVEGPNFVKTIFWHIVPQYCENIIIRGISVNSVGIGRGDGIDVESSRNVLVEYVTLDCGDDCFTLKSGRCEDGLRVNKPSENIVIRHCLALHGGGGVTCGSETAGMIRNLYVHDCVFEKTDNGIRFKTRRNRGGGGENLYYERIRMVAPSSAFKWDMLGSRTYVGNLANRLPALAMTPLTPAYNNICINDVIVENCNQLIKIIGIPESPAGGILINKLQAKCKNLIHLSDVDGFVLSNSKIESQSSEVFVQDSRSMMFVQSDIQTPEGSYQVKYTGELSRPILTD